MDLDNKVAIVTGSGRGIGKAIALKLAGLGARVVINDFGDPTPAEEVVKEIKALKGEAIATVADVSQSTEVETMVETVISSYGTVDILVNNAGITRDQILLRLSENDWDGVINTNLKSVFLCSRAVIKLMMKQRQGRIVNISSIIGVIGNAGQTNYAAAKAGIIAFTKSLAKEVGSRGITVNAVAPGFIETPMTQKLTDAQRQYLLERIPLGEAGTPDDVAQAVAFLASDEARYINGQVLGIDGGMF